MSGARPDTWMPMYWGDYARDTGHLSAAQHGAYLMLIKHYWCTGQALSDDDSQLWRIACCDSVQHWRNIRKVIEPFFDVADSLWRHDRIDRELEAAEGRTKAKAEAGRKGAEKRWGSTANGTAIAKPSVSQRQTDTQSQPQSQPQKKIGGDGTRDEIFHRVGAKVLKLCGADQDPSCRLDYSRVHAWLAQGASEDLIVRTVERLVAAKGSDPPRSLKYFDRAIAEAIKAENEPLPEAELPEFLRREHRSKNPTIADIHAAIDAA